MKIRTDYITNSSSSLFVIAFKSLPAIDEETLAKYPFLKIYKNLVEKVLLEEGCYEDTEAGQVFSTQEEFDRYYIEEYGWGEYDTIDKIRKQRDYYENNYSKPIEYINNGYSILVKDVSYHDENTRAIIEGLAEDNKNFVVILAEND